MPNAPDRQLACLRCRTPMEVVLEKKVEIDRCGTCAGTWYDDGELTRALGSSYNHAAILANMQPAASALKCPCCAGAMARLEFIGRGLLIELENCPGCKGFWVDPKNFEAIARFGKSRTGPRAPAATSPAPGSALAHYRSFDADDAAEFTEIGAGSYIFCLLSNLPLEVYNPVRRVPRHLVALVVANVIVFALELALPASSLRGFFTTFGHVAADTFTPLGVMSLFTSCFLHSGWLHLIVNMYFLWTFGDNVCDVMDDHKDDMGPWFFFGFYATVAVLSSLAQGIVIHGDPVTSHMPSVGASGAVSGVLAAYLRMFPRSRMYQIFFFRTFKVPVWVYVGLWILGNVSMAVGEGTGARIGWAAHLSGFAAGYFLIPYFLPHALDDVRRPRQLIG
jgi:membrane associated rhomboid family serine protease/Zn-finger nucleic acid-binding protein